MTRRFAIASIVAALAFGSFGSADAHVMTGIRCKIVDTYRDPSLDLWAARIKLVNRKSRAVEMMADWDPGPQTDGWTRVRRTSSKLTWSTWTSSDPSTWASQPTHCLRRTP